MTCRLPAWALLNLRHQLQRFTATRPTNEMATVATTITADLLRGIMVSPAAPDVSEDTKTLKPAHHKGKTFVNPWPSFRYAFLNLCATYRDLIFSHSQHTTSSLMFKVCNRPDDRSLLTKRLR